MKNPISSLLAGLSVAAVAGSLAIVGAAPASAAGVPTVCRGTISGVQESADILVPEGSTCTMKDVRNPWGGSVYGSIKVSRNAKLNVIASKVGDIETTGDARSAGEGATVWITGGSSVQMIDLGKRVWNGTRYVSQGTYAELVLRDSSAYTVSSPVGHRNIEISNSSLRGLTAKGGRSVKVTNNTKIAYDVELEYLRGDTTFDHASADSLKFSLGRPNSRFLVSNSTFSGRNWDNHGLEVRTSHEARLKANYVAGGNLRAAKNRSTVEISGNVVRDALSCSENTLLPFAVTMNQANSKTGQCSGL